MPPPPSFDRGGSSKALEVATVGSRFLVEASDVRLCTEGQVAIDRSQVVVARATAFPRQERPRPVHTQAEIERDRQRERERQRETERDEYVVLAKHFCACLFNNKVISMYVKGGCYHVRVIVAACVGVSARMPASCSISFFFFLGCLLVVSFFTIN